MRTISMCFLLALLAGCSANKLKVEKNVSLPQGTDRDYLLLTEPQSREQTIQVAVEATDNVDVGVFLKSQAADPRELSPADREKKAIIFKKGVKTETLSAKIPAGAEYTVLVSLSEKTLKADVKIQVTN